MSSTSSTNATTTLLDVDVLGFYAICGPVLVAGFAIMFVVMTVTLLRLRRTRKTVLRRNKENSNMKIYVASLGIGASLSHMLVMLSWSFHGVTFPGWSIPMNPDTLFVVNAMQATLYSLSAAFDFHISGYWMLLMENFIRSTCGIGSGKNGSGRYGKLKEFNPSILQWSFFVCPLYIATVAVLVLSLVGPYAGFTWTFVESIRVICGGVLVCTTTYASMNLKVVLMASSNLRMLVDDKNKNGTGESSVMSRERQSLIILATRTRNMSVYIAGCIATFAPLCIVAVATDFLSIPLVFVPFTTACQAMLLIWLVIVYFSVLRRMLGNVQNNAVLLTADGESGGGSVKHESEQENSLQQPMNFQEAIQSMEGIDDLEVDEQA